MAGKSQPTRPGGIRALLARYRRAVKSLEKLKAKQFYHGTTVTVNCARYKGPGVAVTDGDCWPDHVAVSLPNGNTWRYPLESVRPAGNISDIIPGTNSQQQLPEQYRTTTGLYDDIRFSE